jgi:YVTN family beta-propeller protein
MKLFQFYQKIVHVIGLASLVFGLMALPGQSKQVALAQSEPSLMFIENVGQFEEGARFQTYGGSATLSLATDALWFTISEPASVEEGQAAANAGTIEVQQESRQGVNLKLSFVNANPHPQIEPFNRLHTHISYFTGSDPANWRSDVPVWGGVRYVDLYPGFDLEITSQDGQLVQRLVKQDGADASQVQTQTAVDLQDISLRVEGAEALTVDDAGRLSLFTAVGEFTLPLLQVDQAKAQIAATSLLPSIEGEVVVHPFSSAPLLPGSSAQIAGASDLIYSTFLGGSIGGENGKGITVDTSDSAYVAGNTLSPDFPTTPGAFDTSHQGQDAFVVKLNAAGSELVYATFLEDGRAFDLTVDDAGNAYVTGNTTSDEFPTTPGAFDTSHNANDVFIAKLNTTGTDLIYATLLGGSDNERGRAIAIDGTGNVYVTGETTSTDFPATPGAFATSFQGGGWFGQDAFVAKLNATGSELTYATFLGGSNDDDGYAIALDAADNAYITGWTESTDFPTTPGAFQTSPDNIFVVKLNPSGSALTYATFLGGNGNDYSQAIAVDQAGNAYVTGDTASSNFPTTPGAFQTTYHSSTEVTYEGDAFVTKFNPAGDGLVYSTFLGGSDHDNGLALAVDQTGNAYVTGSTYSTDLPTTPDAFQPSRSGYPDVFVAKLNAAGSELAYGTFLGGDHSEAGYAIAVDETNHAYVTGYTSSPNFPITVEAFDTTLSNGDDVFISKLATGSSEPVPPTPTPVPVPSHDCAPTNLGDITVGDTPRGIALDPARQRVYVANFGSDSVSVIDTNTNSVIDTITGLTAANGIAYDPTHNLVWVTNTNTDQVTPIEINDQATSFTMLSTIDVGDGPWGVTYDSVHDYVYVANNLSHSVSVIDAASRTVIATLNESFNQPFHLAANSTTGKVYVANFGSNSVTVLNGTTLSSSIPLYDSLEPYGIAVDETRDLVYVTTVRTNRIVAIGNLNGTPDQFLGWSMFYRGFNRQRPLPLRAIAVNPDIGPSYDGGHLWTTTATSDGSELNQALLIPKGWNGYFHVPLPQNVSDNPAEGVAVDRVNDRVYFSSGASPGTITVIGDHDNQCPGVFPATVSDDANHFDFDVFSRQTLAQGDATGDGLVDIFDLTFIAARYDSNDYTADVNFDGVVDIFDLTTVASRYGQTVSTGD